MFKAISICFCLSLTFTTNYLSAQTTQNGTELRESPCHGNCVIGATSGPGCWTDWIHGEHDRSDACTNFGDNLSTPFPHQRVMGNGSCHRFWALAETHMHCFSAVANAIQQCQLNGWLACPRPGGGFNRHYYDIGCFGLADNSARGPMAYGNDDSVACVGEDILTCECTSEGAMVCKNTANNY